MDETTSERRLAENEVYFRQLNERVQAGIDETNRIAKEDNQPEYEIIPGKKDQPLHFYCECSDEKCTKRIIMTQLTYNEIHKDRSCFTIFPGHQVAAIEKVVREDPRFVVVRKSIKPPDTAEKLNPTALNNR